MSLTTRQQNLLRGRNKSVYGKFEDTSKYFRCLNCGSLRRKDRDYYEDITVTSEPLLTEDGLPILTEEGTGLDIKSEDYVNVDWLGCPFCGYLGKV
jgi:hypothetical protein